MKNKTFEYIAEGDMFYIYNKSDEDIVGSLPVGNFVFDVGISGKIVGLEIDNASEIFGISAKKISNVKNAKLNVRTENNILIISFNVDFGVKVFESSYLMPKNKVPIVA